MQVAKWYVKTGERVQGPFSECQIRRGLEEDRITSEMLVRRHDSDWIPADVLKAKFREHDQSQHRDKPINGRLHAPSKPDLPREAPVPAKPRVGSALSQTRRSCPFCAEAIATVAIKCKHCGEFFDGREKKEEADSARKPLSVDQPATSHAIAHGKDVDQLPRKRPKFGAGILSMVLPKRRNGSHSGEIPHDVYARHDVGTIEEFVSKVLAVSKQHPGVGKDLDEITGSDGDLERSLLVNMDDFNMLAIVTILARHNLIYEVLQS